MTNVASILVDLAPFAIGAATGYLGGRVARPRAPREGICPCGHPYTARDPETGCCTAEIKRLRWDSTGRHAGYDWVPCPCRDHASPEARIAGWSPPLLPAPGDEER